MLHGYPQSLLAWRHQVAPLARQARVIAPDWFGWGLSERRLDTQPRYWDEVARIGKLMDALSVERCAIMAHDYGGHLAIGFAARFPERVSHLAVLNSRAHLTFPIKAFVQFGIFCALARTAPGRALVRRLPIGAFTRAALRQEAAARGVFDEALIEHYAGWMSSPEGRRWLAVYFQHYAIPRRRDHTGLPGDIACPVSLIWGDEDPYCPFFIAEDLARLVPHARVVRVPGAGHFVMEERPDEVLRALLNLLNRSN